MNLKPIRTEEEYEEYLQELDLVFDAEEGTKEFDRAELLGMLIEKYEDANYAIPSPDPIEAIKYVMQEQGMKQKDLGELVGGKSKASLILSRKRSLSMQMIRIINQRLKIPLEVLMKEYPLAMYLSFIATVLVAFFLPQTFATIGL